MAFKTEPENIRVSGCGSHLGKHLSFFAAMKFFGSQSIFIVFQNGGAFINSNRYPENFDWSTKCACDEGNGGKSKFSKLISRFHCLRATAYCMHSLYTNEHVREKCPG